MVKSGRKVAIGFVGSFALAVLMKEQGIIEDEPIIVYAYSSLMRDLLQLIPDAWEDAGERLAVRAWQSVKAWCCKLCKKEKPKPVNV